MLGGRFRNAGPLKPEIGRARITDLGTRHA